MRDLEIKRLRCSLAYWRRAYELLVKQTGRDLNDGLGLDPRSRKVLPPSAPLSLTGEESNG